MRRGPKGWAVMGCLLAPSFIIHLHLPSTFPVPGAALGAEGFMSSGPDERARCISCLLELLA